jgi:opacity protein-like surface antigen
MNRSGLKFITPVLACPVLVCLVLAVVTLGSAQAQNYVGLSGGLMDMKDSPNDIDSQGFTLIAAGQYDPRIGIEFTYTSIADVKVNSQTTRAEVIGLSALFRSPGEVFVPFVRVGIGRVSGRIADDVSPYKKKSEGLLLGIGADFDMSYNSAFRVEYVEGKMDGTDTSRFSLGTIYRF